MAYRRLQYLPVWWDDGARLAVEHYLREIVGLDIRRSWVWLVAHGGLPGLPSDRFNPEKKASDHLHRHAARYCMACGVWEMLQGLWGFVRDLYESRDHIQLWDLLRGLERKVVEFRTASTELVGVAGRPVPEGVGAFARDALPHGPEFAKTSEGLLIDLGPDARACVERGGRMNGIVAKSCLTLAQAGFSYPEVASMIGDDAEGAADRVRKRVLGLR